MICNAYKDFIMVDRRDSKYLRFLPQMKSIWLDEDEDTEKLYGLQKLKYMETDDADTDQVSLDMVNSSTPILESTKSAIELPELQCTSAGKIRSHRFFRWSKIWKRKKDISIPFDFQHISHAEEPTQLLHKERRPSSVSHYTESPVLSKAFVTEAIPHTHIPQVVKDIPNIFNRFSFATTASTTTNSMVSSDRPRAVSATTTTESPKYLNKKKLSMNPSHHRDSSTVSSRSSNTLDFLKAYEFPWLISGSDELLRSASNSQLSESDSQ